VSAFAVAKLGGEKSCTAFTLHSGLETVRLRYSNVFGPRQSPGSPHARFVLDAMIALLAGEQPALDGTGLEQQDLILIDDVVQATLAAAAATVTAGRVYNIAAGRATTAVEVVAVLNKLLGTSLSWLPTGRAVDEEFQNLIDISRARAELGLAPTLDLDRCLSPCLQSCSGGLVSGPLQGIHRFTEA
jgi:UDP-glucose 4-epimerase